MSENNSTKEVFLTKIIPGNFIYFSFYYDNALYYELHVRKTSNEDPPLFSVFQFPVYISNLSEDHIPCRQELAMRFARHIMLAKKNKELCKLPDKKGHGYY